MKLKKELCILIACFILPIALGNALFYWWPNYFTKNTVNYGEFIKPIISISQQDIIFPQTSQSSIFGLWSLVYMADDCDNICKVAIKDMKTIHILTNKNIRRIQRILLTNNLKSVEDDNLLLAHHQPPFSQKIAKYQNNTILLIDPNGNSVLSYKAKNIDIKKVVKDLERLLKYSRIG